MLILAIGICVTSCKKQSNTQPDSNTNTTPIVTPTTTPTSTTTVNDTIGKVKIFYSLQMNRITITTGRDYVQDTTNVKIYLNDSLLRNHFVSMAPNGLSAIENGQFSYTHAETPLWCNHGDSIVMVLDSVEIKNTVAQSERFLRITTKVNKYASGLSGVSIGSIDTYQYSTNFSILDPYYNATLGSNRSLGTTINTVSGLTEHWFIGGKFKLVYIIP